MKNKTIVFILILTLLFGILAINAITRESDDGDTNSDKTFDIISLTKFESPYMGDASNLTQLFYKLMLSDYSRTYQINNDEFSVELLFSINASDIEQTYLNKSLIYNSVVAFSLVENLQIIKYNFDNEVFVVTRELVESWFEFELIKFYEKEENIEKLMSEIESQSFIEECIKDINH